ncbi:MAG: zf-HC2 domain-containing protein [Rhizobiales bacterium]|nr:zf-HC2 domain-containing protein [Hyphomicrobiales bacterium]
MTDPQDEPGRIEALLPWYANGTLSAEEAAEVEAALAADPLLRAHLARIEGERIAAIESAEALPLPSSRMADRLFAEIAATAPSPRPSWLGRLFSRFGEQIASLSPSQLGLSTAAAALVLLVVGGALGGLVARHEVTGGYQTASGEMAVNPAGAYLLVAFQPTATAAEIEQIIGSVGGIIVDGPRAGGLYKLRIGDATMSQADRKATTDKLTTANGIVKLVIAAP